MRLTHRAEKAKLAASRAKDPDGRRRATATPPRAGPASWRAKGRANCSMALAWTSSAPGTSWGTRASNDGRGEGGGGADHGPGQAELVEVGRAPGHQERPGRPPPGRARRRPRTARCAGRSRSETAPPTSRNDHLGSGRGHAHVGQRRRVVGNGVRLPGHGDDENAVAQERDGHARPQEPEVPPAQGRRDQHAAALPRSRVAAPAAFRSARPARPGPR